MIFGGESLGQRRCAARFGARKCAKQTENFKSAAKLALKGFSTQTFAPCVVWADEAATVAASHGAL